MRAPARVPPRVSVNVRLHASRGAQERPYSFGKYPPRNAHLTALTAITFGSRPEIGKLTPYLTPSAFPNTSSMRVAAAAVMSGTRWP